MVGNHVHGDVHAISTRGMLTNQNQEARFANRKPFLVPGEYHCYDAETSKGRSGFQNIIKPFAHFSRLHYRAFRFGVLLLTCKTFHFHCPAVDDKETVCGE